MSRIRGTANVVLVATLMRPIARRLIARARQRAREHPIAPLMIPAEGLLEAVILDELSASRRVPSDTYADAVAGEAKDTIADTVGAMDSIEAVDAVDALEQVAGRSAVRTLLLIGSAVAAATLATIAITTIVRRRREARARAERGQADYLAVPVEGEMPADESVEADTSVEATVG